MISSPIFCAGTTPAVRYAREHLKFLGFPVSDSLQWNTGHLLLDVPSFRAGSSFSNEENIDTFLSSLPPGIRIWGGNLQHPSLKRFRTVDLLQIESYLFRNAAITSQCTIPIAESMLKQPWKSTHALIIGWGRIGKHLLHDLSRLGCDVTVAVRSGADRKNLEQAGFTVLDTGKLSQQLPCFHLIINTVPAPVLSDADCVNCTDTIKIDLASQKGISCADVIWARGLPGRCAPEQSGKLIANTMANFLKEELK